jgi:uncharacterized repeat protein (TIGR01451 family)
MTATAPTGYQFVSCDGTAISPGFDTEKVKVPAAGSAIGTFYVNPTSVPTQTIAGHIYLCNSGAPTTTEITGGTLSATGPQTLAAAPNPLAPSDVAAGKYVMTATAPTGYQFVSCDGTAISPGFDTEKVKVPAAGSATGTFYVNPTVPTQTIAGHIYLCNSGAQTTTEIPGGTLSATGPQTLAATPNPLAPKDVAAGKYLMTATAPTGYQFASCDGKAISPGFDTEKVKVPAAGSATGTFYVDPTSVPQTITLTVTETNDANGTGYANSETSKAAGANVPFRVAVTNTSSVPVTIISLTDSWPGKTAFSPTCANAVVGATLQPGASDTCDFTLDSYAPPADQSLKDTVDVTGCQSTDTANCVSDPSTSIVTTPATQHAGSVKTPTATTASAGSTVTSSTTVPNEAVTSLPFTGAPVHLRLLLEIGLSLLFGGLFVVCLARPRRRTA